MRIPIPHKLGRAEARQRLHSRSDEIAGMMPGGMADVTVTWPHEDRMELQIAAMGKSAQGSVEVGDDTVIFEIELPGGLSFVEPMIRSAVEAKGQRLLS